MEMHIAISLEAAHGIKRRPGPMSWPVVPLRSLLAGWRIEWQIRRVIREPEERDDRMLADIGIERSNIEAFVRGAASLTEAGFVDYARSFKALPPMPWYNVHAMSEGELRSLGDTGEAAPAYVPPGKEPVTAFINPLPISPAQR